MSQEQPFTTPRMHDLEQELAATRDELAATVDELVTRLDPRTQATRLVDEGKKMVNDATGHADPQLQRQARVRLGVVTGAAALVLTGIVRRIVR